QPNATKEFFQTEASGLKDLKNAGITVPEVYNYGEIDSDAYLLISFLEEGTTRNYTALSKTVVKMHKIYSDNGLFGYQYPHQGSDITFDNKWTDSWIELFVERRLDKLRDALVKNNKWSQKQVDTYKRARKVIVEELVKHSSKPALLHGDLWGGN